MLNIRWFPQLMGEFVSAPRALRPRANEPDPTPNLNSNSNSNSNSNTLDCTSRVLIGTALLTTMIRPLVPSTAETTTRP